MTGERFDELSRNLATEKTRRGFVKLAAATSGGGVLALIGVGRASAADPGRCRRAGGRCRRGSECCSGLCSANGTCVCPPPRVPNSQGRCVCPGNTTTCGQTDNAQCCDPATQECCESGFFSFCCPGSCCTGTLPGLTTCCPPDSTCCVPTSGQFPGFPVCCPPGTSCEPSTPGFPCVPVP